MNVFNSLLVMLFFVKIVLWSPFRSTRAFQRTALQTFTTTRSRRLGNGSFTATAHDTDHDGGAAPQQQSSSSSSLVPNNNKVHTVTWKTLNDDKDIIFLANHGELLRTAALRQGLASPHNDRANLINCRGLGTCGTCAVQLSSSSLSNDKNDESEDWISNRNAMESFRLTVPPGHSVNNAQRLRLACQVPVQGNVTVQKYNGFWGQYDTLVHPSLPTQPLGSTEFILDRKSPPPRKEKSSKQGQSS